MTVLTAMAEAQVFGEGGALGDRAWLGSGPKAALYISTITQAGTGLWIFLEHREREAVETLSR